MGTFKAGICDGAEMGIEARRPACRFPILHMARRMLSTVTGWGGLRGLHPAPHPRSECIIEPIMHYYVLEQLVSLKLKEQLFICCLNRNEYPLSEA